MYVRSKIQISSKILTSFRQGGPLTAKRTPQKPSKIMVNCLSILEQIIGFFVPNSFEAILFGAFYTCPKLKYGGNSWY